MKYSGLVFATLLLLVRPGWAEEGHQGRKNKTPKLQFEQALPEYKEECGSCHLAFPPGMLPEAAWTSMMGDLANHFGQNAEVSPELGKKLQTWLVANAAEKGTSGRSKSALKSPPTTRITELRWFVREHDEVRPEVFKRPSISSPANCGACHQGAARWKFGEHDLRIPKQ